LNEHHKIFLVHSPAELNRVGEYLAQNLQVPCLILLNGDLGAGKTTFMGCFVRALGLNHKVTSPTFSKVHEYAGENLTVFHLDLYRALPTIDELEEIFATHDAIFCIEWANRLAEVLSLQEINLETWNLDFKVMGENRQITLRKLRASL
jgi:tRNA threonylcarbamoyladenosine biosynthesis protein TsaE